jgi:hypothetical protein
MSPAELLLTRSHEIGNVPILPSGAVAVWKRSHPKFEPFLLDQLVKKKVILQGHSVVNKFKPRYEGPYRVIAVHENNVAYVVEHVEMKHRIHAHHTHLLAWKETPHYLSSNNEVNNPVERLIQSNQGCSDGELLHESVSFDSDSSDTDSSSSSESIDTVELNENLFDEGILSSHTSELLNSTLRKEPTAVETVDHCSCTKDKTPSSWAKIPPEWESWNLSSVLEEPEEQSSVSQDPDPDKTLIQRLFKLMEPYILKMIHLACDRILESLRTTSGHGSSSPRQFLDQYESPESNHLSPGIGNLFKSYEDSFVGFSPVHSEVMEKQPKLVDDPPEAVIEDEIDELDYLTDLLHHTRSRGLAIDLPNVQPYVLEYTVKRNYN